MLDAVPTLYLAVVALVIGFAGLMWSADRFVGGAASIASGFGIKPMIIGLTVVSFGTSAPEIMVSINASLEAAGGMAVGNAIGSNIANIALVLGATTIVAAIPVQKHLLKNEMLVLLLITLLCGFMLYDGTIVFWEGALLLALLIPSIWYLIYAKSNEFNPAEIEAEEDLPEMSSKLAMFWFIVGLVALIASAKTLVWGGREIAQLAGISELIIGLTVIAIGTSLPELAASMASALKGHHDIALGNIIGSNIFNLLAVFSLPGLIHPPIMGDEIFYRDFLFMLLSTLALAAFIFFALKAKTKGEPSGSTPTQAIGRVAGILLLCLYASYMYTLAVEQLA